MQATYFVILAFYYEILCNFYCVYSFIIFSTIILICQVAQTLSENMDSHIQYLSSCQIMDLLYLPFLLDLYVCINLSPTYIQIYSFQIYRVLLYILLHSILLNPEKFQKLNEFLCLCKFTRAHSET